MSEDDVQYPCPYCGEELADMDEMWRQLHINSCGSKEEKASSHQCELETCPFCGMKFEKLSVEVATAHINHCMDTQIAQKALQKKTERCSFCGQNLKDLTPRQRMIHDQTCRGHDSIIQNVEVIHYPKVVEELTTPEAWETDLGFVPEISYSDPIQPPELKKENNEIAVYGTIMSMEDLQQYHNYKFTNYPFQFDNF